MMGTALDSVALTQGLEIEGKVMELEHLMSVSSNNTASAHVMWNLKFG